MRSPFSYRSAILILLLGIFSYLYGLDSRFAPKNGDEYPYMHIVRMTADAGHWLPLQSEMDGIKNTKPPLLFWQGIASTQWASQWGLSELRWPSLVYTALTAFFLFLAVRRFSGKAQTGLLASLVWLSFFATYRYGRPFLTDPPEVFWLTLPFIALLYWGRGAFESKLLFPLLAAGCFGLALLSKSFAYIVPASFGLSLCYWRWRSWSIPQFLKCDFFKVLLIALLALGIFALWFALDPSPEAVWKEFVLGENAGKFDARSKNYLLDLIRGGDSIWIQYLGQCWCIHLGIDQCFMAVLASAPLPLSRGKPIAFVAYGIFHCVQLAKSTFRTLSLTSDARFCCIDCSVLAKAVVVGISVRFAFAVDYFLRFNMDRRQSTDIFFLG